MLGVTSKTGGFVLCLHKWRCFVNRRVCFVSPLMTVLRKPACLFSTSLIILEREREREGEREREREQQLPYLRLLSMHSPVLNLWSLPKTRGLVWPPPRHHRRISSFVVSYLTFIIITLICNDDADDVVVVAAAVVVVVVVFCSCCCCCWRLYTIRIESRIIDQAGEGISAGYVMIEKQNRWTIRSPHQAIWTRHRESPD